MGSRALVVFALHAITGSTCPHSTTESSTCSTGTGYIHTFRTCTPSHTSMGCTGMAAPASQRNTTAPSEQSSTTGSSICSTGMGCIHTFRTCIPWHTSRGCTRTTCWAPVPTETSTRMTAPCTRSTCKGCTRTFRTCRSWRSCRSHTCRPGRRSCCSVGNTGNSLLWRK